MNFQTSQIGEVCIPNINTAERRRRLIIGVVGFVISFVILAVLIANDTSIWWRLILFPMFAGSAAGYFEWRDKTWVGLAARGSRKIGENYERIGDQEELTTVRGQALKVQVKSSIAGLALTLLTLLIP